MCAKLGIEIIAASSPQAKGRVERAHGTHQDRLVKKLRLAGIGYSAFDRSYELPEWEKEFRLRRTVAETP
jgi:hypothetical protein